MFPISVSVPNRFPPLATYAFIAANAIAVFRALSRMSSIFRRGVNAPRRRPRRRASEAFNA
jgi:hypothetical protein